MRVCLVYDCLFPHTVGGAERWYRHLAERLVERGSEVTYLTRRQWDEGEDPGVAGVRVLAVSRAEPLYDEAGHRRIGQALRFGWGVLCHLVRNRRAYDVVHVSSFPYFGVLAARVALLGATARMVVDWHEIWSAAYWREYLGPIKGSAGRAVQRLCIRASPTAFVFSEMNGRRLIDEGLRTPPIKLPGLYTGAATATAQAEAPRAPLVLYAGRHIPEKRVEALAPAIALARATAPELRARILGDGPERAAVADAVAREGQQEAIAIVGFVDAEELRRALSAAEMLVLPSRREGYGMIVIEAAAAATPVVVVRGEDNAATELVVEGVNGAVADSVAPADLARAILRVHAAGAALRRSTAAWFAQEAPRRSADRSVDRVIAVYER